MHRLGAGLAAGLDDLLHHQIAFGRRGRPDQNRLVGHFDVERIPVGLGIDGHGLDTHPTGSLDDPAGDLAAVGDQNSFEHVLFTCNRRAGSSPEGRRYRREGTDGDGVTNPSYSKTKQRQRLF